MHVVFCFLSASCCLLLLSAAICLQYESDSEDNVDGRGRVPESTDETTIDESTAFADDLFAELHHGAPIVSLRQSLGVEGNEVPEDE